MTLLLSNAGTNDLATVLTILDAGTRNKMRRGDFTWGMSGHDPDSIKTMITEGLFYIARDSESSSPVGTIALSWSDEHMWGKQTDIAGYVQRFAAAPGYSGQDIGGRILELALQEVANHSGVFLRVTVPSENTMLRAYYEKHGFTRADGKTTLLSRPSNPVAYYERPTGHTSIQTTPTQKTSLMDRLLRRSK